MDEALKKSGDWPNVAMTPGTYEHAATGEPIEVPESARIKSTEQSIENGESYDLGASRQPESVKSGESYELDTRERLEADELKPCNYCKDGGEPRIVNDGFFYVVGCHECGYTTGAYYTKESAIAAWNTRADEPEITTMYELTDDAPPVKLARLLNCLERDYGIKASWDGLRRVWLTEQAIPHVDNAQADSREQLEADELQASNKPNSQFDALKTAETDENATSKNEIRDFDDSREKLEADVHSAVFQWGWDSEWSRNAQKINECVVRSWLNRQAAITERELCAKCDWPSVAAQPDRELQDSIDSLTAERDQLSRDLTAEHALVTQFEHDNEVLRETTNTLRLSIINLRDTAKDLTAERDKLRAQLDTTRDVAREFRDERDELKHTNSLLQSTIAELGLKVDELQAELLEARASGKADPVEIQLALARFAEEWVFADTRVQEQRLITYHAQQIVQMVDNPGGGQ